MLRAAAERLARRPARRARGRALSNAAAAPAPAPPPPPKRGALLGAQPRGASLLRLDALRDNPFARRIAKRLGRGPGSGKGKTAGRGHKGQKARSGGGPKLGFEGGTTPLWKRTPKRGFKNPAARPLEEVQLGRIDRYARWGRLDASRPITLKSLYDARLISKIPEHGVKLIGGDEVKTPNLRLEVTAASARVRSALEKGGGKLTTVYYNTLGLRALLRPDKFEAKGRVLPRPAKPPPKLRDRFDVVPDRIHDGPVREDRPAYPAPTELQMARHARVAELNERIAKMRLERSERERKAARVKAQAKEERKRAAAPR